MKKPYMIFLLASICCLLWGSAFPCIKIGYELFEIVGVGSQLLFAGIRFILAGLQIVVFISLVNKTWKRPKKENIPFLIGLGMVQTFIQYFFFYIGMAHTNGVRGAILNSTSTFFAIVFAHFLVKGEKITLRKFIGCMMGFLGILVLNMTGDTFEGGFNLIGDGSLIAASMAYGVASVILKLVGGKEDSGVITGYQFLFGGVGLALCGSAMGGELHHFTLASSVLLFYMGLISAVAFTLWAVLLNYNPVGKVTIFSFMTPVFGTILSAALLGEELLNIPNLLALLLACSGILIVNGISLKKCTKN